MNKPAFDPNQPFEAVKPPFDPNQTFEAVDDTSQLGQDFADANKMDRMDALETGIQQGVGLGFTPVIAGMGAGVGSALGEFQRGDIPNEGLSDKLSRIAGGYKSGFLEGKHDRVNLEKQAQEERPGYALGGQVVGNVITSPLIAAKGLMGALKLGGIQGVGNASSNSENAKDAGLKFVEGLGTGAFSYGAGKVLEKGAKVVGPAIGKAIKSAGGKISDKIGNAATKIGSTLTGVSEGDIKTYAKGAKEISQMAKAADGSISEAADQIRQKFSDSISATRSNLNAEITNALKTSDKVVEVNGILSALASQKSKLNVKLYTKEVAQIDDLIEKVGSLAENGKVRVADAHDIKTFLQDRASSAYGFSSDPASLGAEAAKAAKSGAAIVRRLVNTAEPQIASANNKLSELHNIIDDMNKNVLNVGKPEAALLAAGSGGNVRNADSLAALGKATGSDMIGYAQKLSAMRTFNNPQILPTDTTGKAVARMMTGAGAGTLIGGPIGSLIGAAATSPMALKKAIDTGVFSKNVIDKVMGKSVAMTEQGLGEVVKYINTPQGKSLLNQVLNEQNIARVATNPIERRMQRISEQQK